MSPGWYMCSLSYAPREVHQVQASKYRPSGSGRILSSTASPDSVNPSSCPPIASAYGASGLAAHGVGPIPPPYSALASAKSPVLAPGVPTVCCSAATPALGA